MIDDNLIQKAKSILMPYVPQNYRLYLFGSRQSQNHHRFSDIDIGIEGPKRVPLEIISKMNDALEQSDLPVKVDVVDFNRVSTEFSAIAKKSMKQI